MSLRNDLKALATEWISLWSAPADWQRFDALHADAFVDHSPAGRQSNKEGFAEGMRELLRAFPDLKATAVDFVVDEERSTVAVRWSATGTNRERYLDVGPTRRRTTITGIEIIEVRRHQIVKRWGEWDVTEHLRATE